MMDGEKLRDFLIKEGISKVGYAAVDVSEFESYPYAVSLVRKLPKKAIKLLMEDEFQEYWKIFHSEVDELTRIALETEELINGSGHNAFALTMKRNGCDMEKLLSKIPYKTLATSSGLGWIGRSALFVCEEYGSAVALSSILTDMPLEVGSPITDSFCDDCEECQKACPVDAINPTKWNSRLERSDIIDIEVCSQYIIDQFRSGLGCSKCMSNCRLTQEYLRR